MQCMEVEARVGSKTPAPKALRVMGGVLNSELLMVDVLKTRQEQIPSHHITITLTLASCMLM